MITYQNTSFQLKHNDQKRKDKEAKSSRWFFSSL